jgi:hypothetical protein
MNLLRIVSSMAWCDRHLAKEEVDVMLVRFSEIFAKTPQHQKKLQQELQEYLVQNIPLEDLVPQLETEAERQLVLKLGYEVIASSARSPEEPNINSEEAQAYQKLVELLALPADVVADIEAQVNENVTTEGLVEQLTSELNAFLKG